MVDKFQRWLQGLSAGATREHNHPRLHPAMDRCHHAIIQAFSPSTRVSQPAGGIVLWVALPEAVDANRLYDHALRAGVSIAPGTMFTARRRYTHHIRRTGGWWDDAVEEAFQRVGHVSLATRRGADGQGLTPRCECSGDGSGSGGNAPLRRRRIRPPAGTGSRGRHCDGTPKVRRWHGGASTVLHPGHTTR